MNKELPKMYHNKINKSINSIQKVYSTIDDIDTRSSHEINNGVSQISIDKKIDNIFNSYDYVYKADVKIITDNETLEKRVVARNKSNLITIDGEYIPINIIRDIYKK